MKNQKTEWWKMRAARADKANIAKLKKQMKVRSESEAVRRAVALAIQVMEGKVDQTSGPVASV